MEVRMTTVRLQGVELYSASQWARDKMARGKKGGGPNDWTLQEEPAHVNQVHEQCKGTILASRRR